MRLIFFLIVALAITQACWQTSNKTGAKGLDGPDVSADMKDPLTTASFGLLGVNFYESSHNLKRWNVQSAFAEIHRAENYIFLKTVEADFFAERTKNVIHTVSDHGRSALDKNEVDLEGHVHIRSRTGYEFVMNSLKYDGQKHQFRTPDDVVMQGPNILKPNMILHGTGLSADIDQEHFFLHRRVTSRKRFKGNDWLLISSQQGEFFTEEQHAIFSGRVQSSVPPGLAVQSDFLELISTDNRELMEARGNVTLQQKDKLGWAESAFFEAGGEKIILEGSARLESKGNEIRGRRIVLYTTDDRVEVNDAQGRIRN